MIHIWYTTNVVHAHGCYAAEVIRHWDCPRHPTVKGALVVWADLFCEEKKAKYEAEWQAARYSMEREAA